MRIHLVVLLLVVCGACLFAVPQLPAPAEPQQAEVIDFDALRAQATAALETLQQSQEHRLTSAASTAF
jgi:cytochrome c-type biogenesis protein CcmH/NrfG